jgi:hypothetical protein
LGAPPWRPPWISVPERARRTSTLWVCVQWALLQPSKSTVERLLFIETLIPSCGLGCSCNRCNKKKSRKDLKLTQIAACCQSADPVVAGWNRPCQILQLVEGEPSCGCWLPGESSMELPVPSRQVGPWLTRWARQI